MATILVTMWNPLAAGAPMMATQFTEGLREAGYDVVVAHGPRARSSATDVLDRLRASGATLREIGPLRSTTLWSNIRRTRDIAREFGCVGVLATQQADRIVAAAVARSLRLPFVSYCGLPTIVHGSSLAKRVKAVGQAWAFRCADIVVCPSPLTRTSVITEHGVAPDRARLLYNGIDTVRCRERADEHRESRNGGPRRLVSIGRTQWEKGHDLALRALIERNDDLPDWTLTIFGSRTGGGTDAHDALIDDLVAEPSIAGRVTLPGWTTDVAGELGRSDVYLHPSRTEGWSLAVCEAMAAAVPVIISDCAGRPDGFENGVHGWIVPTGDVGALGEALVDAVNRDDDDLRAIGIAASEFAAHHFDIGPCRAELVRWFDDLLTARSGPS